MWDSTQILLDLLKLEICVLKQLCVCWNTLLSSDQGNLFLIEHSVKGLYLILWKMKYIIS